MARPHRPNSISHITATDTNDPRRVKRRIQGHIKQETFREMKTRKREEAEARQEFWNGLTPQQKIDSLDARFGKDVGATKQRLRLFEEISKKS